MTEVLIYGDIGFDNTAKTVREQLEQADGSATVRINSGGGDVYEGVAILNALRAFDGDLTVVVESLAASAASFVAVGCGARVIARPNAELMLHKAWTMPMGNADDLRKTLADLDRQDLKLAAIYAERAGGTAEGWLEVMASETWYTAQEALEAGLIDAIEDAKRPAVAASMSNSRVYASCRYAGRKEAPAPVIVADSPPLDKEDSMNILNKLAEELGKKPDEVRDALSGFFNETVQITGEVDVTYPEGVKVAPTEKVTVKPLFDGAEGVPPAGVVFELGTVPEGYVAEVAEDGVVAITAPSGAEVDSTADFTVKVGDVEVPLVVTVRAVSDGEGDKPAGDPAQAPAADAPSSDSIPLDRETYAELRAAAKFGWQAMEQEKQSKLEGEVDGWIREGRISASLRPKAVKAIKANADIARDLYGSNPVNTVPRAEVGYGSDPEPVEDKPVDLRALAKSRLKAK